MTRLQRFLCVALGSVMVAVCATALGVHAEAEEGRRALVAAERSHVRWLEVQVLAVEAEGRVRDLVLRTTALKAAIAAADRAVAQARASQ